MTVRLTRVERRLMAAEYLIDSTNAHVRKVGCDDVKPFALRRYSNALNAVRSALLLVRNGQGARHPTLFAGGAEGRHISDNGRGQKQKPWGSTIPHGWPKDCKVIRMLDPEIEKGKVAECWHCDEVFTKAIYCADCGFYICPFCEKCACQLPPETRKVLEKTVRAMAGLGGVPLKR